MSKQVLLAFGHARLVFDRTADRWRHALEINIGGWWQRVLESVEGNADDHWPPSPPLQSLHEMPAATGQRSVVLLGAAGTSHWSVSVTETGLPGALVRENSIAFHFDVACRTPVRPHWLGSSYSPTGDAALSCAAAELIELAPTDDAAAAMAIEANHVSVRPTIHDAPPPQTVRWQYLLRPPTGFA